LRAVWKRLWPYLPTVPATLLVSRQWWDNHLLGGHSANMDYLRMVVMDESVRQGDFWPRFAEAFYRGHGSLLFHFYAPLSYWLTEIFVLAGAGVPVALKLIDGLFVLLSGWFLVLLVKELFGPWGAAAAGSFYVLAPYHLTDVLVRHAFGEAICFAWLPLTLWGILGAIRDRSVWRMAATAAGCALLLLTHNITAMIGAPWLAAWWLYWTIALRREGWRGPAMAAAGGVGGLLLAAFFWLPAFAETDFVWSKRSLIQEYFIYSEHFVYFKQFFSLFFGHGGSRGLKSAMSFQLGLAHWLGLATTVPAFIFRKSWRGVLIFWWSTLLAALVMCHFSSWPIWRLFPILKFVQFPWRFLILAALAASIAVAAGVQWIAEIALKIKGKSVGWALAALFVAAPMAIYYPYTYSLDMFHDTKTGHQGNVPPSEYAKRLKDGRVRPMDQVFTAKTIRNFNINATARDDYLPKNVTSVPQNQPTQDVTVEPEGTVTTERLGPRHYLATVDMKENGGATLQRFWYPGWRATVDGKEAPCFPADEHGLVTVPVNAGEHRVEFTFGSTPLRTAAWLISLAGLLATIGAIVFFRLTDPARKQAA